MVQTHHPLRCLEAGFVGSIIAEKLRSNYTTVMTSSSDAEAATTKQQELISLFAFER